MNTGFSAATRPHRPLRLAACLAALLVSLPLVATAQTARPQPEGPSGTAAPRAAVVAERHMVSAANPIAADVGRQILRQGGSAVDAAVAMQMVLTLVEPQSSGIGGGAFLVHYNAETKKVETYDGREMAPAAARADMFLDSEGKPLPFAQAAMGGHAVGVPGLVGMLALAHDDHGRLPWARLFEPAMRLATDGFAISPRLFQLVSDTPQLKQFPATREYFFDADGNPKAVGTRLSNAALAETMRIIANGSAPAFYSGGLARAMVRAVGANGTPGPLTVDDLKNYKAVKREPICAPYRQYRICGMGPPSSGGVAIAQILGMIERFDMRQMGPNTAASIHTLAEAERLAFADRARYIADADFEPAPLAKLVDRKYLAARSKLISPDHSMGKAEPGRFQRAAQRVPDTTSELPATTHFSVVDGAGNAVAMTSSIEQAFGSRVMVRGFLLNNHMTDFALKPRDGDVPNINRIEPGKRPRSSMSPTIVVDRDGKLVMTLGSPGGARIIPYVAQAIVAALDWNLDLQRAFALPHAVNLNGVTELERDTPIAVLAPELRALGHEVVLNAQTSGLHGIQIIRRQGRTQLVGGADPRREGEALGD
ncbi:MAG: gamma-glutamyltransferase [Proteobacteria bacterium]|nr:gamma-glutamyltransferase [Pseudomonadota bacterium]